ncbi:MAG: MFS transporter [Gammaproteobacteria bacterium]|nr:MFS transporter [Gammaproteobacteria bacterium]
MTTKTAGTLQGIILILPITLTVMGAVLLAPIMPKLMDAFGHIDGANYLVPMLISIPALCIAIGAPFAGWLADNIGRRRLLIWSMGLYSVCGLLPLIIDSYWPLLISRIGVGLCEAIVITCSTTLIGDFFTGDQRDKWLGSQAAMASLSAMCLFPLAGFLGSQYGWKGPFAIYGVALIMMAGVIFFTWETGKKEGHKHDLANHSANKNVSSVFPWSHMLKVCGFTLVGGVMFYILQFQLSTALATFDINDPGKAGLMLAIASIGVPVGAIAYRYAHSRLSIRHLIMLEFGILALGFFGMSQSTTPEMLIVTGFINQFGAGLLLPTMLTWAVSKLEFTVRGRGTGMWQSTFAVGQFASTISFAFVLGQVGEGQFLQVFQTFAAIALVMCFITVFFVQNSRVQPTSGISSH